MDSVACESLCKVNFKVNYISVIWIGAIGAVQEIKARKETLAWERKK